jgi:hypothetical protein
MMFAASSCYGTEEEITRYFRTDVCGDCVFILGHMILAARVRLVWDVRDDHWSLRAKLWREGTVPQRELCMRRYLCTYFESENFD